VLARAERSLLRTLAVCLLGHRSVCPGMLMMVGRLARTGTWVMGG
jgi:hypothetical protein